ncbi:MAG: LysR family transcriptional regulator [Beijerinckiaceae bacterium]
MDRLDELRVLLAILDSGSLAGAARRLRRSPPSITRSLAALEDRLGRRLVERSTRKLAVSAEGFDVAARARQIIAAYDGLSSDAAAGTMTGLLRITAPVLFGRRHVMPLLAAFGQTYPQVRLEVMLQNRVVDMIEEQFDIAIRIGALPSSDLTVRKVGSLGRVLVAAPNYIASAGLPRSIDDLAGMKLVVGLRAGALGSWTFGQGRVLLPSRMQNLLAIDDVEAAIWCVKSGHGIGRFLSYQVDRELAEGALVRLLPETEPKHLPVHVLTLPTRNRPIRTTTLAQQLVDKLRDEPLLHQ